MWKTSTKKYAFIGTSCAGKTTTAYGVLAALKVMKVSCDGVMQQDRRINFDLEKLISNDTGRLGRYHVVCNQILREVEMTLKDFAVLVSDRSPLDLYAYYEEQFGVNEPLKAMVIDWCINTFEYLFFLSPLPYKDDQQRPPEDIRDSIGDTLLKIIATVPKALREKIVMVPYGSTQQYINIAVSYITTGAKPLEGMNPRVLSQEELNSIPYLAGVSSVLVGGSYAKGKATPLSDLDLTFSLSSGLVPELCKKMLERELKVPIEVRVVVPAIYEYLSTEFKTLKRE